MRKIFVSSIFVMGFLFVASDLMAAKIRIEPGDSKRNSVVVESLLPFVGLNYHPITPCRAYDTPYGIFTFEMVIRGFCGVPEEAEAITFTVAAWQPVAAGNLLFWQGGAKPLAVTLNYNPSVVASTGGVVWLCDRSSGACEFDFLGQATQSMTRMIFDVTGYYAAN